MSEKKEKHNHLPSRLNILFLITFLLFSALIFRLGIVQIVHGEQYLLQTERNTVQHVEIAAPRGWMLDRHGEVLVDNKPTYTVTYTYTPGTPQSFIDETVHKLAELINMSPEQIKNRIDPSYAYIPQRIKPGLTDEERFLISERLADLPGIDVMLDSKRNYVYGGLFRQLIGKEGQIPRENLAYYTARGYAMNEHVGTSYLELQYEEQLRGTPSKTEIYVDRSRRPIADPEHTPGKRGNDLVLTIDRGLQQYIELAIAKEKEINPLLAGDLLTYEEPMFIALDPWTGEILGISDNVFTYRAGNYAPGSTVKMASVLIGLHEHIFHEDEQIRDTPDIRVGADGTRIRTWNRTGLGMLDSRGAISQSSNIYVAQVALRMGGASGPVWTMGPTAVRNTLDKVREYYAQFGLGVKTGIDLPNEGTAWIPSTESPGLLAQYMFGQLDQYTPLQVAQYIATLANGGYRLQPHLVKEVRRGASFDGDLGQLLWEKQPNILNRVDMSDQHLEVIKEGMVMTTQVQGGTAYRNFQDMEVVVAAKTGTTETDRDEHHSWFVGFAPAENPEIAFVALTPYSSSSIAENNVGSSAQRIAKDILEYYFNLKDEEEMEQIRAAQAAQKNGGTLVLPPKTQTPADEDEEGEVEVDEPNDSSR